MRKGIILVLIAIAVVAAAILVVVLIRHARPPAVTRRLPPADAYFYLDLATVRRAGALKHLPNVEFDPEYGEFVRQTGFQFERDLDEAAFAVHFPPAVPLQGQAAETRYSEVFAARFDEPKLTAYLRKLAVGIETYRGISIYVIQLPGRTLRVGILGKGLVAASNTEGPYVVQGIIDREREMVSGTPELIRAHYRDVPIGSLAWVIARTVSGTEQANSKLMLPGGLQLFFPGDTVVVASVGYLGSVVLRAQAIAPNADAARRISDQLSAFLSLYRAIEGAQPGSSDPEVKQFFDSIQVLQKDKRAELTATVPPGLFKKIAEEPSTLPSVSAPTQAPTPPAPRKRGTRRRARH